MNQIIGYTIARRESNLPNQIFTKGFYVDREKAMKMMTYQAEEYCDQKVGANNFIVGQLENSELRNKINDGLVLLQDEGFEVKVMKRTPRYIASYTEYEICRFSLLTIVHDKIIVRLPSGEKQVIDEKDRVPNFSESPEENVKERIMNSAKNGPLCNSDFLKFEAVRKELIEAVKKRKASILCASVDNDEICESSPKLTVVEIPLKALQKELRDEVVKRNLCPSETVDSDHSSGEEEDDESNKIPL